MGGMRIFGRIFTKAPVTKYSIATKAHPGMAYDLFKYLSYASLLILSWFLTLYDEVELTNEYELETLFEILG